MNKNESYFTTSISVSTTQSHGDPEIYPKQHKALPGPNSHPSQGIHSHYYTPMAI